MNKKSSSSGIRQGSTPKRMEDLFESSAPTKLKFENMCLYTTKKGLKFAKEDIVCYKVFAINDENTIVTPFLKTKLSKKQLDGKKPFRAKGIAKAYKTKICDYSYGKGLIHAYINQNLNSFCLRNTLICKCHIPKHTRYITGCADTEIAAKKIIIDKVVWDGKKYTGIGGKIFWDGNEYNFIPTPTLCIV